VGNVEAALEALKNEARHPMFDIYWAECDPHLRWIRDDPRFAAILASPEAKAICQTCAFNGQGKSPINFATYGLNGSTAGSQQANAGPTASPHVNGLEGDPSAFTTAGANYTPIIIPDGFVYTSEGMFIRIEDRARVFNEPVYDLDLVSARNNVEQNYNLMIKFTMGRAVEPNGDDIRFSFEFGFSATGDVRAFKAATLDKGLTSKDYKLALEFMMSWQQKVRGLKRTSSQDNMGWTELHGNSYGGFTYGDDVAAGKILVKGKLGNNTFNCGLHAELNRFKVGDEVDVDYREQYGLKMAEAIRPATR
jgi:hypothetical protein